LLDGAEAIRLARAGAHVDGPGREALDLVAALGVGPDRLVAGSRGVRGRHPGVLERAALLVDDLALHGRAGDDLDVDRPRGAVLDRVLLRIRVAHRVAAVGREEAEVRGLPGGVVADLRVDLDGPGTRGGELDRVRAVVLRRG